MKKILVGITAMILFVGAGVFANNANNKSECPNHPGCVCNTSAKATSQTSAKDQGNCPFGPGCVCNH